MFGIPCLVYSPQEIERQTDLLRRVRSRHHFTLLEDGVYDRIASSEAKINQFSSIDRLGEPNNETRLFVARFFLGDMAIGRLIGGAASLSASCPEIGQDLDQLGNFLNENHNSDALIIQRQDATKNGYLIKQLYAGVRKNVEPGYAELLPVVGVERNDLEVVIMIANELTMLRSSLELSCLSRDLMNDKISSTFSDPLI